MFPGFFPREIGIKIRSFPGICRKYSKNLPKSFPDLSETIKNKLQFCLLGGGEDAHFENLGLNHFLSFLHSGANLFLVIFCESSVVELSESKFNAFWFFWVILGFFGVFLKTAFWVVLGVFRSVFFGLFGVNLI